MINPKRDLIVALGGRLSLRSAALGLDRTRAVGRSLEPARASCRVSGERANEKPRKRGTAERVGGTCRTAPSVDIDAFLEYRTGNAPQQATVPNALRT